MRLRFSPAVLALAFIGAGVGCARTEQFDIVVRNETKEPVTLALTKDGPPFERLWAGPEDLAIESPKGDEQHGYEVIPPGREGEVRGIKGRFDRGTRGYLRVYRGDLQISDMNAIGPVSPNRLDLPLRPGPNGFVIADAGGRLVATDTPVGPPAP